MKYSPSLLHPVALAVFVAIAGPAWTQTQNSTTSYQYDAQGNLTQITDPLGHITKHSYDALNRRTATTGANNGIVRYAYDGQSQLTSVTDPRNLVTTYTLDGLGNQTALTSPDTGITGKTYDAAGNLKTSTDARGKTTTYSYDVLNRVIKIAYASGTPTTFEYDGAPNAIGLLTRMLDESGQTTYTYDAKGRLVAKAQTVGTGTAAKTFTVSYTYGTSGNTIGKLTSLTYPSGNRINFTYDTAGRINGITFNPTATNGQGTNTAITTALLKAIGYAPFGAVNSWTWGNSTATAQNTYARGIDLDGRVTSYPLGSATTNGLNRTLSYDAGSRITGTTHIGTGTGPFAPANFNQTYGYDNLDRLTSFTGNNASQSFQYDQTGNRTQATFGSSSYTNSIASTSNRLTATSGPAPAKTNSYDAAGNLLSDGRITYTYSDRGRMKTAIVGGDTISYLYNGMGQRVQKSGSSTIVATGANSYVYDEQGHLIGEYDATGKVLQETVYLGDIPVVMLKQTVTTNTSTNPATVQVQTNAYYIYADHINTPRVITRTSDNQIVWRWDYADPFGMQSPDENPNGLGTFTSNLRFPGQYFDKETNLHYNMARMYDPQLGRFTQFDPSGLRAGINGYIYVINNPLIYVDPDGLEHRSGQWKQCGGGCRIRIDYDHVGSGRHLHWECPGKSGEMGEFGGTSHGGSHADAPNAVKECARKNGFEPEPKSEPKATSMCGPTCQGVAVVGGVCLACVLAPELCIPGLIVGGAAAQ